jgi:hypothetical protein
MDKRRVHHGKVVKAWLSEHEEQIEIVYLPSYSPVLNPDEYLSCDLKAGVHSGKPAKTKAQLNKKIISQCACCGRSQSGCRSILNMKIFVSRITDVVRCRVNMNGWRPDRAS